MNEWEKQTWTKSEKEETKEATDNERKITSGTQLLLLSSKFNRKERYCNNRKQMGGKRA